jgi:hypothetical protein
MYVYDNMLVMPTSRCKLRLLRLERIKDWLVMEEDFLNNQEAIKPHEAAEQVYRLCTYAHATAGHYH